MEITYLGHASFKIKGKSVSIVVDPFDEGLVGLKFPQVDADIVTVSHQHGDHNKTENVTGVRKVVSGPGEYEIAGVSIIGVASFHDNELGAQRGKNTIYVYEIDGLRIAHLGDLGHKLDEQQLEDLGDVDVLFIPVGGHYTIDATEAVEVAQSIEPHIIIPMHYKTPDKKGETPLTTEEEFVNQLGLPVERLPKLILKESLPEEEQKIVILERK